MNQRAGLLGAAALAFGALAVIQATSTASDRFTVFLVVVLAAVAGGLVGYVTASSFMGVRGVRVRRPGSVAQFMAALVVGGLFALITSLLIARLGLHLPNPAATFVAISPLLALLGFEIVYGLSTRMGD